MSGSDRQAVVRAWVLIAALFGAGIALLVLAAVLVATWF